MKKVSFDFDGTLSRPDVQSFAKEFLKNGFEVWLVTSRDKDAWNSDLYSTAFEIGIPIERIVFTCFEFKYHFFYSNNDFLFHLDDDWVELKEIDIKTKVRAIPVNGGYDWQSVLFKYLENEK